jgi:hypothetical protein
MPPLGRAAPPPGVVQYGGGYAGAMSGGGSGMPGRAAGGMGSTFAGGGGPGMPPLGSMNRQQSFK